MNKRERVMAAIRGEEVDRVPFSFWLHNFAREDSAQALAEETLRLHRTFDWDFLKPQSRYQCFAEMWGLEYRQAPDRAAWPVITKLPVRQAADLASLSPADPTQGALAQQLEAMTMIRAAVGPDVPVVATVFAPLMVAQFMVPGGIDAVLKLARENAPALERGLEAIAATQESFTRELVRRGVDGIFYATNVATKNLLSRGRVPALPAALRPAHPGSGRRAPVQHRAHVRRRHPLRGVRGLSRCTSSAGPPPPATHRSPRCTAARGVRCSGACPRNRKS